MSDGPYVAVPRDALEDLLALVDKVTQDFMACQLDGPLCSALRGSASEIRSHALTSV
jgi:hypothetical protein